MHPKILASSIADLRVGMRVTHYNDRSAHDGETGTIARLALNASDGGHVWVRKDGPFEDASGIQRYFNGFSGNRKWEILPSTNLPQVGDTVRLVDVTEGVVSGFFMSGDVMVVQLQGTGIQGYRLEAEPFKTSDAPTAREWTITKKAVPPPPPWQAGDLVKRLHNGTPLIRQADGQWLSAINGNPSGLRDADMDDAKYINVWVRGGKKA